MERTKYCTKCGIKFERPKNSSNRDWLKRKYCSQPCQLKDWGVGSKFKKGHSPWNKGKTGWMSAEGKQKIAENQRKFIKNETPEQRQARMAKVVANRVGNWTPPRLGKRGAEVTGVWLDDEATYNAKHRWIQKNWEKTGKCQNCGRKPRPFGNRKYGTEWANLDSKYDRNNKETWQELCVKCHRQLDREQLWTIQQLKE